MITGILLPHSALATDWFGLLSAFVAINTVMYVTLAIAKVLPRPHLGSLRRRNSRSETRSIHPDAPVGGPPRRLRASRQRASRLRAGTRRS